MIAGVDENVLRVARGVILVERNEEVAQRLRDRESMVRRRGKKDCDLSIQLKKKVFEIMMPGPSCLATAGGCELRICGS